MLDKWLRAAKRRVTRGISRLAAPMNVPKTPPVLASLSRAGALVARRLRAHRSGAALAVGVVGVAAYVIAYPFCVVTYPPITDLPFHAAASSILRHYFDPAFHFREQFELHFFEVPYASMYVLGALFALFLPIVWAIKLTAMVLLAQLPLGLAVLFHGMKKSPLWGLLGLGFVWCMLTHWGFLNFMAAIGLFAMVAGCTLLVLDHPTRRRQVFLTLALFSVFFTHIYRFPFAVAAVVGITVLMLPATRRWKPVVLPLGAALAMFGGWSFVRRKGLGAEMGPVTFHKDRLAEIPEHLFTGFMGNEETLAAQQMLLAFGAVFVVTTVLFFVQRRHQRREFRSLWWGGAVTALPVLMGLTFLLAYLVLPMSIGLWWFVYPREITTAAYIGLAAMPDMPKNWWLRLPLLAVLAWTSARMAFITATHWHGFEASNADFAAIMRQIPDAPKLMYLVFDHSGSSRRVTPYIHMPAWVQAEKGGWLSFHFIGWDTHPMRYRLGSPQVPPATPDRWEWTPERFDLQTNGAFFDTFLVRSPSATDNLFTADPTIRRIGHEGRWWLYRRER
jgi:hypothetical protein